MLAAVIAEDFFAGEIQDERDRQLEYGLTYHMLIVISGARLP